MPGQDELIKIIGIEIHKLAKLIGVSDVTNAWITLQNGIGKGSTQKWQLDEFLAFVVTNVDGLQIAYADTAVGTGFQLTQDGTKDYIGVIATTTLSGDLVAADFANNWFRYKGDQGIAGINVYRAYASAINGSNEATAGYSRTTSNVFVSIIESTKTSGELVEADFNGNWFNWKGEQGIPGPAPWSSRLVIIIDSNDDGLPIDPNAVCSYTVVSNDEYDLTYFSIAHDENGEFVEITDTGNSGTKFVLNKYSLNYTPFLPAQGEASGSTRRVHIERTTDSELIVQTNLVSDDTVVYDFRELQLTIELYP
jgi:hypothetical protein